MREVVFFSPIKLFNSWLGPEAERIHCRVFVSWTLRAGEHLWQNTTGSRNRLAPYEAL